MQPQHIEIEAKDSDPADYYMTATSSIQHNDPMDRKRSENNLLFKI